MSDRVAGQEILNQIAASSERLRDAATKAAEQRDHAAADLDQLNADRDVLLTRLAELSLPSLESRDVESTHAGVRERLRELAARRTRSEGELAARRRRLQADLDVRQQAVLKAEQVVTERTGHYESRVAELESFLENDADYQAMKVACDQAQARLQRDRDRLVEVEQDASEKLPDYEASRLFTYLRDRKFSTPDYRASGLVKSLDRKVARLIDYASLSESYRFLTTVPSLMKDELAKREQDVDDLVDQLLSAVKQAERTFDLAPLKTDLDDASKVATRAKSERDRTADHLDTLDEQLSALRTRECRFYSEAIDEMKRFLASVESEVLARQAGRTETLDDDDAVAELRACREQANSMAAVAESASSEAEKAAEIADGLDFVLRRARQTDLGSERAHFEKSFDASEPLRQFEKGVIDRNRLLEILKDAAELDPTWTEKAYRRGAELANSPSAQILLGTAARAAQPLLREALRRRMR